MENNVIMNNLAQYYSSEDIQNLNVVQVEYKNCDSIRNSVTEPDPNTIYFLGPIMDNDGSGSFQAFVHPNDVWVDLGTTYAQPVDFYNWINSDTNGDSSDDVVVESNDDTTETTEKFTTETNTENSEEVDTEAIAKAMGVDPENPLSKESMDNIRKLIKSVGETLQTFQSMWLTDAKEWNITREQVMELYKWTKDHNVPLAEDASEEDKKNYDPCNGIKSITAEECLRIFGEGHKILHSEHTITVDRVTDVLNDWYAFVNAQQEYREIMDAYSELMEMQEEENINQLKAAAESIEDPDEKAKRLQEIDNYLAIKFVDFMKDPVPDDMKNRIVTALSNNEKIQYLIKRTKDKLTQMKLSSNAILEITQFEKRFLDEKYAKCNQCILVYFMHLIVYCNISNNHDVNRDRAICLLFALDGVAKGTWQGEKRQRVIENLEAFCDQFIDIVPTPDK